MHSKIFEGIVEHERFAPATHRLAYSHHVYAIDLDELEQLDRRRWLFGYNRSGPVSLHDADHLAPTPAPIRQKLLEHLPASVAETGVARVVLVTAPRWLGYVFNPVSFYFCFAAEGGLLAVVAEVNNTFGEKHVYVLDAPLSGNGAFPARYRAQKAFHVSPFNSMAGTYTFTFADVRQTLDIAIDLHRDDRHILRARLKGKGVPLTAWNQVKSMLRHPVRPHLTMSRIYREAFKLKFARGLRYYDKPIPGSPMTIRRSGPTRFQRYATKLVTDYLNRADSGALQVTFPDGSRQVFGQPEGPQPAAMRIADHRFFSRLVLEADIGLGEAFMVGEWDTDDVPGVLAFFIRNRRQLAEGQFRESLFSRLLEKLRFLARANTLTGSRRNIRAHYDLSNAFFQTFLDETMAYSCAVFDRPDDPLAAAQRRKFDRIMNKARIGSGDHVLEIGCGWGGFAIETVRRTGCRVTGITISREQYDLARERVRQAGLSDRIDIRLCDYRRMRGRFDKIVSIEMLEAVGHRYYGAFFNQLDRLLAPDGIAVIQTITIPDQRYDTYRREHDWIQKHIFPGGLLPSLTALTAAMTRHSRLMVDDMENIGEHYATTLARWHRQFVDNRDRVAALGFDTVFQRKWIYYLGSCEAAFRERAIGNLQLVLTREGNRNLVGPTAASR